MTFSQDNQFAGKSTNPMEKFSLPTNGLIQIKSEEVETYKKEILQLLDDKQGNKAIQDYVIPILNSKNKDCIREMLSEPLIEESINNYITFLESKLLQMIAYTRSFKNQSKKIDEFKRLYLSGIEIIMPPIVNSADVQKSTEETNVPKQVAGDFSKTDESDTLPIEIESKMANIYRNDVLLLLDENKGTEAFEKFIVPILRSENMECVNALIWNKRILNHLESFISDSKQRLQTMGRDRPDTKKEKAALLNFVILFQRNLAKTGIVKEITTQPPKNPEGSSALSLLSEAAGLHRMSIPSNLNQNNDTSSKRPRPIPPKSNTTSKKPKMSH